MNYRLGSGLFLSLLFFFACNDVSTKQSDDELPNEITETNNTPVNGSILGRLSTKDSLGQAKESYSFNENRVFLYSKEKDTVKVVDSTLIDGESNFKFEKLKPGKYFVANKGDFWAGEKSVELDSTSNSIHLDLEVEIAKIKQFELKGDFDSIKVSYGPIKVEDKKVWVTACENDSLSFGLRYKTEHGWKHGHYKSHLDKHKHVKIISDDEEVELDSNYTPDELILVAGYQFDKGENNWFVNTSDFPFNAIVQNTNNLSATQNGILMPYGTKYDVDFPTLDPYLDHSNFSVQATFKASGLPDGYSNVEGAICGATAWMAGKETYGFELRVNKQGYIQWVMGHASSYYWTVIQSKEPINLDEWYTVTVGYLKGKVELYINDRPVKVTEGIEAVNTHGIPFDIGYRSTGTPRNQFQGEIKSIEVYQGQVPHRLDLIPQDEEPTEEPEKEPEEVSSSSILIIESSSYLEVSSSSEESSACESMNYGSYFPLLSFRPSESVDGRVYIGESFADSGKIILDSYSDITEEGLVLKKGHQTDIDLYRVDGLINWENFIVEAVVKLDEYGLNYTGQESMIVGNQRFDGVKRGFELRTDKYGIVEVVFSDSTNSSWQIFKSSFKLELGEWYELKMTVLGSKLYVQANRETILCETDLNPSNMSDVPLEIGFRQVATPRNPVMGIIKSVDILNGVSGN